MAPSLAQRGVRGGAESKARGAEKLSVGWMDMLWKRRGATSWSRHPREYLFWMPLLAHMRLAAAHPPARTPQAALVLPEKDRPVLAAAIRLECGALITGDRTHLGAFYGKTLGGVTIYSKNSPE